MDGPLLNLDPVRGIRSWVSRRLSAGVAPDLHRALVERPPRRPGIVAAMHLRVRDVVGALCLAGVLVGLVILFVVGNIPAK